MMNPVAHFFASPSVSRREFLRRSGSGFGLLALSSLLDQAGLRAADTQSGIRGLPSVASSLNPLAPRLSHFSAKARSVIWLFMNGGQSQVDTWDYKPEL